MAWIATILSRPAQAPLDGPCEHVGDQPAAGGLVAHAQTAHEADGILVGEVGARMDTLKRSGRPEVFERRPASFRREAPAPERPEQAAHQFDLAGLIDELEAAIANDGAIGSGAESPMADAVAGGGEGGPESLRGTIAGDQDVVPEIPADPGIGPQGMEGVE